MASHHHHPTTTPCCYTHCCCPPPPPDPHLHFHPPPQSHLYSFQPHLPNLHQHTPNFQEIHFQDETNISALLRRIAALETALRRRSSSSPVNSLRHAAAQTIQTHFRAFLLNRSRTLRQLKELAAVKTQLGLLKLSVSERSRFDYEVVYRKARALLVKLAAIQGCDPMIRDGKTSVSRDLKRFLDYIDGFVVERMEVNVRGVRGNSKLRVLSSARKMDNTKCGGLKRVSEEKLRSLVERIDKLAVELDEEEDEETGSPVRGYLNSKVLNNARGRGLKSVNEEKLQGLVSRIDKLAVELDDEEDEETGSPVRSDLNSRILSTGGVNLGGSKRVTEEKLRGLVERIDKLAVDLDDKQDDKNGRPLISTRRILNQSEVVRPRKRVTFGGSYLNKEDCDDRVLVDARVLKDDICREVEEIGVSSKEAEDDEEDEDQSEDGGSSHGSEGDLRSYPRGKR